MCKTNERLVNDFALAVKALDRAMTNRDKTHSDYRTALARCHNAEAEFELTRKALYERLPKD